MRLTMDGMQAKTLAAFALAVAMPIVSYAESSLATRRDRAMAEVSACLQSKNSSGRQCKHLGQNVDILVDVYQQGDKSVLSTLFQFTYLGDFYDRALLADPKGFLTAMTALPDKDQKEVAAGLAGGMFGLRNKERFDVLHAVLMGIPDLSPLKAVAQSCLQTLEGTNAVFLVTYFSPGTFAGPARDFVTAWYSREMYALGERPLWPASQTALPTYRFTYLPAFAGSEGSEVVTLIMQPDGSGQLTRKVISEKRDTTAPLDETTTVLREQLPEFFDLLDQARFWVTPNELPSHGRDGAQWLLEGVQDGKYRVVVRWCPDVEHQSSEEAAFANAGSLLLELGGHKRNGGC
jgi:hypothetical protein